MNIFYKSIVISILYVLVKFIEMRFIVKKNKPLKFLFRDGLIVYLCSVSGFFLIQQFTAGEIIGKKISAFTNDPDF